MPLPSIEIIVEALAVVGLIGVLSLRFRILNLKGVIASVPVGLSIYIFGGREFFILLLVFYVLSSAATWLRVRYFRIEVIDKEWVRGWRNVAANGIVAASAATLNILSNKSCFNPYLAAYLGAVGTAFADTLATEIGLLYPRNPRLIVSMKKVPRGTPGAVSPYGYLASILALSIFAAILSICGKVRLIPSLYIAGLIGVTIDSILGGTVQAHYRCVVCGKETENPMHCGRKAEKISGVGVINTHTVNFLSTLAGAVIASLLFYVT